MIPNEKATAEEQMKIGVINELQLACKRLLAAKDMEAFSHAFIHLATCVMKVEVLVLGGKVTDAEGNSYDLPPFKDEDVQ
jgi:hypothetical protein